MIPPTDPLPGDDRPKAFLIIGDDAFSLRSWLMKPFFNRHLGDEWRIFNYRQSRARKISENAFGILAHRFTCLLTTMRQQPQTVVYVVLACICQQYILILRYPGLQNAALDMEDAYHQGVSGAWRNQANMTDIENIAGGNRSTRAAKAQRLYLKHYLNSPAGSVPWQRHMI